MNSMLTLLYSILVIAAVCMLMVIIPVLLWLHWALQPVIMYPLFAAITLVIAVIHIAGYRRSIRFKEIARDDNRQQIEQLLEKAGKPCIHPDGNPYLFRITEHSALRKDEPEQVLILAADGAILYGSHFDGSKMHWRNRRQTSGLMEQLSYPDKAL